MSLLNAFSGDLQHLRRVRQVACQAAANQIVEADQKAASVLPDPVGAEIKTCSPLRIAGQARSCGSVAEPKRAVNQSRTMG
jgi:hypothetical protein